MSEELTTPGLGPPAVPPVPPSETPPAEQTPVQAVESFTGPNGDERYRLKVDGEWREVDKAKMIQLAQKGWSADEKFREAAEIKKKYASADKALAIAADIQSANKGDWAALKRVCTHLGYTEQQAAQIVTDAQGAQTEPAPATPQTPGERPPTGGDKLTVDQLPDEVKQMLAYAQKAQVEQQRATIFAQIDSAVDNDQRIGKIADRQSQRGQYVRTLVKEAVRRRVALDGREYGPPVIEEAIGEIADLIKHVGSTPTTAGSLSLGQAPVADGSTMQPEGAPKRVASYDPDFKAYVLRKLQYDAMASPA